MKAGLMLFIILLLTGCVTEKLSIEEKARMIHEKVFTLDSHTDTPLQIFRGGFDLNEHHDPHKRGGKVDFPRMKEGGLDAVFFAVFLGQGKRTPEANQVAKERALKIFNSIYEEVGKYPDVAEIALTPEDGYRLEKEGKRAIYIGMENGYPIGTDLSLIKKFYDLGARYITLCHTKNNDICDSSTDPKGPEHGGLSDFGKQVVKEMNRLGMMIDVSHMSDEAFYDVLESSNAPVIASHSCARALCDNPRNLTDDMLKKLADKGGVIQMCILSAYVKKTEPNPQRKAAMDSLHKKYPNYNEMSEEDRKKVIDEWYSIAEKYPQNLATVQDVVDHIDHIVQVAGIDHVGIGTDFDGGGGVEGCYDVSEMGNITLELVKRGYTEEEIRKIWGGNFMRVFSEVMRKGEMNRKK